MLRWVLMSSQGKTYLKFGSATILIVLLLGYLAYTGVQDSKSYYVTISELHKMGNGAYSKRLRVAGNVQPGSIKRVGPHVQFVLMEQDQLLPVDYTGTEAPPDTFKDDSQALADGSFGHDGVFHAKGLQAKCASKYAPQQPGAPASGTPAGASPKSVTQVQTGAQPVAAN
jgi:cytochrome c-type biogenesis protein CcmE